MKQVVLLGDQGAGKTAVAAALADLASQMLSIVIADADVDADGLQLVLAPTETQAHDFICGKVAVIDAQKCTACGTCAQACRFGAVVPGETSYSIQPTICEGCHSCFYQCPAHAIAMQERRAGQWFQSRTRFGPLLHARICSGQQNSSKLITLMKQQARLAALNGRADLLIVDGPGSASPQAVAAGAGADLVLLVIAPATSSVQDLERALGTVSDFRVPAVVCINQADTSPEHTAAIADYCRARGIGLMGKVPVDPDVSEAMARGQPVTACQPEGLAATALRDVWQSIRQELRNRR